jgi:hypothetical protein
MMEFKGEIDGWAVVVQVRQMKLNKQTTYRNYKQLKMTYIRKLPFSYPMQAVYL